MEFFRRTALGSLIVICFCGSAVAADIMGAGSTFVFPVLSRWSAAYREKTGVDVQYESIGSGGGIAQIKASNVDFGASDSPLRPEELHALGLAQFPLVIGGIVPVVNVEGIKSGQLKLTGTLLADVFLGKVKKWNDPQIQSLNPELKLPAATITVVHRTDGSGTTFNWVDYLSKVSSEWRDKVGEGTSVAWPVGAGGKGNEGVAALVKQTPYSIGYVEYAYVQRSKLIFALVRNKAGNYVTPSTASFKAAATTADWAKAQDFYLVMTDAPGAEAYPIAATSFVIMRKAPKDPARSKAALDFFRWALENGQQQAIDRDYTPLPADLTSQIESYLKSQFATVN